MIIAATVLAVPEDTQKAAPLGLLVVVLLGVACYFLFKSMSRHLRRVREDFPTELPTRGTPATPAAPEKPADP